MSIKIMKWNDLMTKININDCINNKSALYNVIKNLNDIYNEKVKGLGITNPYNLTKMYEVVIDIITKDWNDLDIGVSSFGINQLRVLDITNKYIQYVIWATKVVSDDGIAGIISNSRILGEKGVNTGKSKDTNSDLPQVDVNSQSQFELDMSYVSNINNNDSSSNYNRDVNETTNMKSRTWEQEVKNLQMVYMNEIVDYITKLPYTIYKAYSLDATPVPLLISNYMKSFKDLYNE